MRKSDELTDSRWLTGPQQTQRVQALIQPLSEHPGISRVAETPALVGHGRAPGPAPRIHLGEDPGAANSPKFGTSTKYRIAASGHQAPTKPGMPITASG